ncbi:hypothetical protein ACVWZM_001990 [Bradyrhizobium sp. USDA 4501]
MSRCWICESCRSDGVNQDKPSFVELIGLVCSSSRKLQHANVNATINRSRSEVDGLQSRADITFDVCGVFSTICLRPGAAGRSLTWSGAGRKARLTAIQRSRMIPRSWRAYEGSVNRGPPHAERTAGCRSRSGPSPWRSTIRVLLILAQAGRFRGSDRFCRAVLMHRPSCRAAYAVDRPSQRQTGFEVGLARSSAAHINCAHEERGKFLGSGGRYRGW